VLAPLAVEPKDDQKGFRWLVADGAMPKGDQLLVTRLADPATADPAMTLTAGIHVLPVGLSDQYSRVSGAEEDFYKVLSGPLVNRLVVVRGLGQWPIDHQVAGLLVVPGDDPLCNRLEEVAAAVDQMRELRQLVSEAVQAVPAATPQTSHS
jgi:hypothetical protein